MLFILCKLVIECENYLKENVQTRKTIIISHSTTYVNEIYYKINTVYGAHMDKKEFYSSVRKSRQIAFKNGHTF